MSTFHIETDDKGRATVAQLDGIDLLALKSVSRVEVTIEAGKAPRVVVTHLAKAVEVSTQNTTIEEHHV